jgi:hypothetical protein
MLGRVGIYRGFRGNASIIGSMSDLLITLMIEAVSTRETSVYSYQAIRLNIPEDSRLHTRRRENLKFHLH